MPILRLLVACFGCGLGTGHKKCEFGTVVTLLFCQVGVLFNLVTRFWLKGRKILGMRRLVPPKISSHSQGDTHYAR